MSILQKIVSLKYCETKHKWPEIGEFVGLSRSQARTKYVNWQRYKTDSVVPGACPVCEPDEPEVYGLTADYLPETTDEVWDRAFAIQDRKAKVEKLRSYQAITFKGGPIGWAWLSDLHFGGDADYRQIRRDAVIIRDTEGMYASFNGDASNNWIVSKLSRLQREQRLAHDDEWVLFADVLRTLGRKLKVVSLGNHDLWTLVLSGVDRVRDFVTDTKVLYDEHEVVYHIIVGESSWKIKQRHSWRGRSVFNPTHGIEVAWQRAGDEFDIGVGGHDHYGTICRPFFRHGKKRFAVKVGTYSMPNGYGREIGAHPSMDRGCGAMIFQDGKEPEFFNDLETAAEFLGYLRQKEKSR